jgi:CheY-like chemotaxis protein
MPSVPATFRSATRVRRPGRILVVDDEPSLSKALSRLLSDENEVVVVGGAAAALARLERGERYDVVLCDLMMPLMDGIELHRRLSLTRPEEAERMVFMTGGAMTARIEAFFRRVPNLLLHKPIDLDGLRALIERRVGAPALAASS